LFYYLSHLTSRNPLIIKWLEDRGSISDSGRDFLFATTLRQTLQRAQVFAQCVPRVLSLKVRRLGWEDNHSLQQSALIKLYGASYEAFVVVMFPVEVFWVVTPFPCCSPWRWRQHGRQKRWYPTTTLHGVTTQETSTGYMELYLHYPIRLRGVETFTFPYSSYYYCYYHHNYAT
jgi:hypothetical protein